MKVSRYTPSLLAPEDLEAIFVQRHKLANKLVSWVQDSVLTESKHYTLLIGPRGIGKTHLVSMLYHRVKQQEDLQDQLVIAWMREEEWGLGSFFDLVLRILRALQQEYKDEALLTTIEGLYDQSPEEAERIAVDALKAFIGERTLLLLIENLDEVFGGLGDLGQKQLRSLLQETSRFTIVATSQSLFNGVKLQTSPFYGFFRIRYLKDFSVDEAVSLLAKIAQIEGNTELVDLLRSPKGRSRVQAVHHLAGGNPRIYVVFSEFLTRESLDQLIDPFISMLDDLTPYYQARMMYLSAQQRKIIEVLSRRRYAMPVKEIAQQCFATPQTVSSQLKDLRDKGYVLADSIGRQSFYELREPLMRICLSVKEARGEPVRLIVDFLRAWYPQQELQLMQQRSEIQKIENSRFDSYLKLALENDNREGSDPRIVACYVELPRLYERQKFPDALLLIQKLVKLRGISEDFFAEGFILSKLGREKEAVTSYNRAIELMPDDEVIWFNRGTSLTRLGQHEEATQSYEKAIELKPDFAVAWYNQGYAQMYLGRYEEAISSLDKAISLNPETPYVLLNKAEGVFALNPTDIAYETVENALKKLTEAEKSNGWQAEIMLRSLFQRNQDSQYWQSHIEKLVTLFDRYQFLNALNIGLTQNCNALLSKMVSDSAAQAWLDVWTEIAGKYDEFQIPLRLLKATVRYKQTPDDPRVFFELPTEERKVLKQALGLET